MINKTSNGRLLELDALRGIAVLFVVFFVTRIVIHMQILFLKLALLE